MAIPVDVIPELRRVDPAYIQVYTSDTAPKKFRLQNRGKRFQWFEKQLTALGDEWKRLEGYDTENTCVYVRNVDDDETLVLKSEHAEVMGLLIKYGTMLLDHQKENQRDILEGFRALAEVSLSRAIQLEKVYGDVLELARKSAMKIDGKGDMPDQLMGKFMDEALPQLFASGKGNQIEEALKQVQAMKAQAEAKAAQAAAAQAAAANSPPKGK